MDAEYALADSLLDPISTSSAYGAKANIWHDYVIRAQLENDPKKAVDILINQVLPNVQKAGDDHLTGSTLIDVGTLLSNLEDYERAVQYFNQGTEILKETSAGSSEILNAYFSEAYMYVPLKQAQPLKILLDSAKILLQRSPVSSEWNADYLYFEGCYFRLTGRYHQALESLDKGIAFIHQYHLTEKSDLNFRVQKFNIYGDLGDFNKSKNLMLTILRDTNAVIFTADRIGFYSELAKAYYSLGNFDSAYQMQTEYSRLSDSLHRQHIEDEVNNIEAKYRTAQKEKQILTLQAEQNQAALRAQKQKSTNHLLIIGCAFLLILALFTGIYYKRISKQKEINHLQQLTEIEQRHQLTISHAMLEGEERERKRVARELHDGLGGMLSGMRINLSGWAARHEEIARDRNLGNVITQLDSSVSELRRIARNMMPETLLKFGLEIALKDLCEFYMRDHIHIDLQSFSIQENLPLTVQINIYRIVQELLTNAIRHAKAENIVLQCSQDENNFFITIEDNGIGFDTALLSTKRGMGLDNVKNRVEYLKGTTEIISSPGEGTTINIELKTDATA